MINFHQDGFNITVENKLSDYEVSFIKDLTQIYKGSKYYCNAFRITKQRVLSVWINSRNFYINDMGNYDDYDNCESFEEVMELFIKLNS
jgi:hypothetical protein